jgi:glutaredoxin
MDIESPETFIRNKIEERHIVFFSKPGCTLCVKLMDYLIENSYTDYLKIDLDDLEDEQGLEVLEFLKKTYEISTFPICFMDSIFVGSYSNLIDKLKCKRIFSTNTEDF